MISHHQEGNPGRTGRIEDFLVSPLAVMRKERVDMDGPAIIVIAIRQCDRESFGLNVPYLFPQRFELIMGGTGRNTKEEKGDEGK